MDERTGKKLFLTFGEMLEVWREPEFWDFFVAVFCIVLCFVGSVLMILSIIFGGV